MVRDDEKQQGQKMLGVELAGDDHFLHAASGGIEKRGRGGKAKAARTHPSIAPPGDSHDKGRGGRRKRG